MSRSLSHIVFRNAVYNFLTQIVLVVVSLWSIPYIINGLSSDQFGLLSILWAYIGYFALLDLGISRAIVKFVSEAIGMKDAAHVRTFVWTSVGISLIIGTVSCIAVVLSADIFLRELTWEDQRVFIEAKDALIVIAFGIPFLVLFGTIKGFQMACQRFDIYNTFQLATGVIQAVGTVILVQQGNSIYTVVQFTIGSRVLLTILAFVTLPRLIEGLFTHRPNFEWRTVKRLLSFGGWITVSQLISPLFLYLDRVFIGLYLPLSFVALYTVPQEALSRLLIIPMSLTTTLFPALSVKTSDTSALSIADHYYQRSFKYLTIVMLPVIALLILFAREILLVWVGEQYALASRDVFWILVIGVFFNSIAQIPVSYLHALGRPDLTAKLHMIELPFMIVMNIILVPLIGIIGTAVTWSVRVIVDTVLLIIAVTKSRKATAGVPAQHLILFRYLGYGILGLAVASVMTEYFHGSLKYLTAALFCILYGIAIWIKFLNESDKEFLHTVTKKFMTQ